MPGIRTSATSGRNRRTTSSSPSAVRGFRHDFDPAVRLQQHLEPSTEQRFVVG